MEAIKQYHPAVGFWFFMLMIIISLASMHPVFQIISFIAAIGYGLSVSGPRAFVKGSWWLLILIIIVALFNTVFSGGSGLTVLFMLNLGFVQTPVTVESFAYGLCMGLMLANVILWFSILGKVSSMQGFIELFSKLSPTIGMMIARITVFIPELLAQARLVDKAQSTFSVRKAAMQARRSTEGATPGTVAPEGALSAAAQRSTEDTVASQKSDDGVAASYADEPPAANYASGASTASLSEETASGFVSTESNESIKRSRKGQLVYASALSSHLMEWGMEKSLITASSMIARGYGSRKRTSFRRTHLTLRDAIPLVLILITGFISLVCTIWAGMEYLFYPYLSAISFWWGYLPFVLFCLMPLILQVGEELAWWRSR